MSVLTSDHLVIVMFISVSANVMQFAATAFIWIKLVRIKFLDTREPYLQASIFSRRQFALELLENWDSKTVVARADIMNIWRENYNNKIAIPWSEIEKKNAESFNSYEVNRSVPILDQFQVVSNYLELMATAVLYEVADEEIVRLNFGGAFLRWHHIFGDYRENLGKTIGYDAWKPINALVEKWHPK